MPSRAPFSPISRGDHIQRVSSLWQFLSPQQRQRVDDTIDSLYRKHKVHTTLSCDNEKMKDIIRSYDLYSNSKASRYGCCNYSKRQIQLSTRILPGGPYIQDGRSTLMHEIAHAISYHMFHYSGHGKLWKICDVALGNDGSRCGGKDEPAESVMMMPVVYACPNGHLHGQSRRSRGEHSCGKCSRKFDRRYLLKMIKGPTTEPTR